MTSIRRRSSLTQAVIAKRGKALPLLSSLWTKTQNQIKKIKKKHINDNYLKMPCMKKEGNTKHADQDELIKCRNVGQSLATIVLIKLESIYFLIVV